jgi:uncharacterized lipoprotein YmbA
MKWSIIVIALLSGCSVPMTHNSDLILDMSADIRMTFKSGKPVIIKQKFNPLVPHSATYGYIGFKYRF